MYYRFELLYDWVTPQKNYLHFPKKNDVYVLMFVASLYQFKVCLLYIHIFTVVLFDY